MSEHHRGAWDTRGDAVWWPGTMSSADQQLHHHQQLLTQHHQQQLAAQQLAAHQNQQNQLQHNDSGRNPITTSSSSQHSQQLFSYKMASSFPNPSPTGVTVSSTGNPVGAYDYRLGMNMISRPGDPPSMPTSAPAAATQWWYTTGQANIDNAIHQQQQHQQQNQHQSQSQQNNQQNVHNAHTPPSSNQHLQQQQQQQSNSQVNNQQMQIQQTNTKVGGKGKHADGKPRGRMTAYAFFVQTCREEHKKKHPDESVIFAEFSKKCAERWKTMLDKEKKRFHEMAEKDKMRYDQEMQNYIPPKGTVVGRGKKRKHIKDPNAPKRSLSAFFWFCHDERGKVKAVNPDYGVGDIAKELGKKWADAQPETKHKYEEMADKDKKRYEIEMTDYKLRCKTASATGIPVQSMQQHREHLAAQEAAAMAAHQQMQGVAGVHPDDSEGDDDEDQ